MAALEPAVPPRSARRRQQTRKSLDSGNHSCMLSVRKDVRGRPIPRESGPVSARCLTSQVLQPSWSGSFNPPGRPGSRSGRPRQPDTARPLHPLPCLLSAHCLAWQPRAGHRRKKNRDQAAAAPRPRKTDLRRSPSLRVPPARAPWLPHAVPQEHATAGDDRLTGRSPSPPARGPGISPAGVVVPQCARGNTMPLFICIVRAPRRTPRSKPRFTLTHG